MFPNAPSVGLFDYDFTSMSNSGGLLPVGTYFWLGDVDDGSGNNEVYEMQAFDTFGNLLSNWLDEPIHVHGAGVLASNMPNYFWNAITSTYIFDGNFVPGNPSIGIIMESNQEMASLGVNKLDFSYNFAILAPLEALAVPAPATAWLFGFALIGLAGIKRKQ